MAAMRDEKKRPGWRAFVSDTFEQVEADCRARMSVASGPDWKTMIVLVTTAIVLTAQHYLFILGYFDSLKAAFIETIVDRFAETLVGTGSTWPLQRLARHLYWAIGVIGTYVVLPVCVVKLVFRERLVDYGLKVRGLLHGGWLYLAMFAFMFPFLVCLSTTVRFQETYPFYDLEPGQPLWPLFWIWELFYVLQFVSLEFFFRGFIVHGTKHRFGVYSIFVMMVPYCMIHFGKPLPETCGAIGAGVVLGFMSLKTRSIWLGAALHVAVAISMDLLSLWRQGMLG
jgi:membrane protease YdiL (CAAX protease family)